MNNASSSPHFFTEEFVRSLTTAKRQQEFYEKGFRAGGSFGIRVGSGGKKAFFLIYSINQKRKRLSLGLYPVQSIENARAKALHFLMLVANGQDPAAERRRYALPSTFGELCELFLKRHVAVQCKVQTATEYRRIIERELLPAWQDRLIVEIQSKDIFALIEEISTGRGSPIMAERVRRLTHRIFKFAESRSLIHGNPVEGVEAIPHEAPRRERLSLEELQLVWLSLQQESPQISALFRLLILTAQRPSLVLAMKWADLEGDTWVIHRGEPRRYEITLSAQAKDIIHTLRFLSKGSEYLFPGRFSSHTRHIRKAAKRIASRVGLSAEFSPSLLRLSAGANLRILGVRPDVIERILGRRSSLYYSIRDSGTKYDYRADIQAALELWSKKVVPIRPPTPRMKRKEKTVGKVIELFPRPKD